MDQRAELSEFLRSRRARLQPQDVGLPDLGRHRRVPGLRREELAQLAGVSVAYYTRLEQGHGSNVSSGVLDSVARALRLSDAESAHLTHLAGPKPRKKRAAAARPQRMRPELQHLMDAMDSVPAYVLGRRMDVLGSNRLARALFGDFTALPAEERNMARIVFLDPNSRDLFTEWECVAAEVVSTLRLFAGCFPDDPQLSALVGELSVKSDEFRVLWAAHTVRDKGHCVKRLHHPLVGALTLTYETLNLPGDQDQSLIAYHAEPGTDSVEALRLLASWGVDETPRLTR
ncbi:helix-turn-helix domain-containing protein [Streptomyces sp. NPDC090052]|uniref:helix-turn-helix domain-containing protein n=1 Tax=unclassified Streptomyces TaxID=2593676 RepID=UPI002259151D|nr:MULTISPECIES: helix-turn-helix transcriptional regulator [unclassified Streptomyces]MCX4724214.1 helix-turn-helix transcriptional regulator [Streptomyces sp. NBC_01306]WSV06251.1 helix-turn-helix transcriptional regulator [Streptomyces sp. NBC_01020]WSX44378.1 helix-turn-helix transcriptional regulator [Streptomyces sp. NBC_00963]WSX67615.1 helix-turn-helix transcriptional regulator [Streptomyces sp. NBC_00932]